jgi:hypothetical protein
MRTGIVGATAGGAGVVSASGTTVAACHLHDRSGCWSEGVVGFARRGLVASKNRWIRTIALLCGTTMLGGCYMYSTVSVAAVPVGSDVRTHVTAAEADRVAAELGYRSTTLEGRLMGRQQDGQLLVRVPGETFSASGQTQRYYQRIALTPADVLDVQTRKLNMIRTGALAAVGVGALVIIVKGVFSGQTGGIPSTGGGTTHNDVLTPIR